MDRENKDTNQHQSSAENNSDINNMVEKFTIFIMSIPIGQYAFEKVDGGLKVIEETAKWLQAAKTKENSNGIVKGHKACQNGHAHAPPEEVPTPYDTRPLLSLFFIPFLFCFILCQFYVNMVLFMLNKPPLKSQDIKHSVQKIRRRLTNLRLIGSKNLRNKQKLTAQRLNQNPPQLNIICRVFSKWPLKLFVKRLRKILNFLGIITLPLPSDLKQNSVGHKNKQKTEEQFINEAVKASKLALQSDGHSDSESSYEDEDDDEEYYEETVKTEPSRRVSVTVQEIILEENEEESISNLKQMKDQLNQMESDQTETSSDMPNDNLTQNFSSNEPVMVN